MCMFSVRYGMKMRGQDGVETFLRLKLVSWCIQNALFFVRLPFEGDRPMHSYHEYSIFSLRPFGGTFINPLIYHHTIHHQSHSNLAFFSMEWKMIREMNEKILWCIEQLERCRDLHEISEWNNTIHKMVETTKMLYEINRVNNP
ncbi:hypothetical protein CRM22_009892 [Opisthorchis felineus]|uniref:Uncharacterized protein n=1 Tax=Opisthorchis felineus TaxID=147828 RepID=A0A4S2LBM6_OPIFE|nr:hypothetical protein CRM22_009892 [Opisthorchis felineus]